MKNFKIALTLFTALACFELPQAVAKENTGQKVKKTTNSQIQRQKLAAGCENATAAVDLDVNNVRARIMNGGDMWWDLVSSPKYEIPKVTESGQVRRHSLFAGALWIGGYDNGNLKLAAMTYRQTGSDFFPGPLDTSTATIESADCKSWDKIWKISRVEIDRFRKDNSVVTDAIRSWPAHGLSGYNPGSVHSKFLAPFVDVDGDYRYNPDNGDYPDVFGDQTLWYIYNDKGNIHSETQAEAIGLELQTQAFAFATNDEINNMTFYTTTIVNRSKSRLDSTFFGQWVDADLGYAFDDYVAVDTTRSLGICYNGDDNDEGVFGYGANPPSIGVDFFEGPRDANGKPMGVKKFVYYNNDFTNIGNPSQAPHFYRYLTGHWKNGDPIVAGCNGWICPGASPTDFMFPGDPRNPSEWSEVSAGNKPGDRRFLQSAGPFSLKPGAKNNVTVGVVWAKATTGGPTGSFDLLKLADDKAQTLYNNKFKLIDGPDAPEVEIRELDRKLVLAFQGTKEIENYTDSLISNTGKVIKYRFQGYQIFQLKSASINANDIGNFDLVRPVAQVDLKDQYTKIVNSEFDPETSSDKLVVKVNGENKGVKHTFVVTEDAFAANNRQLVNYKFYYYLVMAYAVADDPTYPTQYLAGRKTINQSNLMVYTGIPHNPVSEFGGTKLQSDYGDGPELTQVEGLGNGGSILDLTVETENRILANGKVIDPTYKGARGPVAVRVYDPTKVVGGQFELRFIDNTLSANPTAFTELNKAARWKLTNLTTGEVVLSDTSIGAGNEQLIYSVKNEPGVGEVRKSWGFAITVTQPLYPGTPHLDATNGLLEATITYANDRLQWLDGIHDVDHFSGLAPGIPTPGNWIRAGKFIGDPAAWDIKVDDSRIDTGIGPDRGPYYLDPAQVYESLLGGIITPSTFAARSAAGTGGALSMGPIPNLAISLTRIQNTPNVDLVFTSDMNKWSECVVIEMGEAAGINEGGTEKFKLRNHAGWMKEIDAQGRPVYSNDPEKRGKSWFPGYAINLETGDRLNIMFGEDSHLPGENGADMLWNPTSTLENTAANYQDYTGRYIWGGKHWIYIMNSTHNLSSPIKTAYDGCNAYYQLLKTNPSTIDANSRVWANTVWVMEPMLAEGSRFASLKDGLIPTDVRIRLRLSKPYVAFNPHGTDTSLRKNSSRPMYTFSTDNVAPIRNGEVGKQALEMVNVVPNPYYSVSDYETSQLDNRVRFTNLPAKCEISIYTLDGTLVRKFNKDETANRAYEGNGKYPSTLLDWDLKNQKGVPVASGVYIIHINAFEAGEKVIKWFGVMKPVDLDSF